MTDSRFRLTVSLNVLEHLGINLYSNVPSVLSEIVANSWDADAGHVRIQFDRLAGRFTVQDDGTGMTAQEVNDRFLMVGHRRRDAQPGLTAKGRRPMGRKGIGKLSLFSIAETVKIETLKGGEKSALRMELGAIRETIQKAPDQAGTYQPIELSTESIDFDYGTRITLTNLRRQQTMATNKGLRKRVARRFSVIDDPTSFVVTIDGRPVTPADRDYYPRIQYIWTYGDQSQILDLAINKEFVGIRTAPPNVTGWLGTVKESKDLRDIEENENMNRIAIFVRGKLAQEDILGDFSERGVFAGYLVGELKADDFDTYDGPNSELDDDAATSSRQKLVENDPRYEILKSFLNGELKHVGNKWSDLRSEAGTKEALSIPEVSAWMQTLEAPIRRRAESWLGKLNKMRMDNPEERIQLMRHAVLGFEFHRLNNNLEALDKISDENLPEAMELFKELDSLEATLYGQIVKQRVSVIRTMRERVEENALEKTIQSFLFKHLWLLDPSWERVEGTEIMEANVTAMLSQVETKLDEEERRGRVDIAYRKAAGKHIIVELKRPDRRMRQLEMTEQARKYYNGLRKLLVSAGMSNEPIEIVFVLGAEPIEWGDPEGKEALDKSLDIYRARIVFYQNLLINAERSYSDYLDKKKHVDLLSEVMSAIDNYDPPKRSANG